MKALAPIIGFFLMFPLISFAQGEYDDLYYTAADREADRKEFQSQVNYPSEFSKDYTLTTPEINSNRIYNTSQGRTVNPEYIAQYRSRAEARAQNNNGNEEVYFDENYDIDQYNTPNTNPTQTVVNNYYGNDGLNNWNDSWRWADPFYDPFYVNDWRWRYNNWRWRRSAWFWDPYWTATPGWSFNVSFGWGAGWGGGWNNGWAAWGGFGNRWARWSYDPWFSPYYYGGVYYSNFYDPFWCPPAFSRPVYITNVYNGESNRTIRNGRAAVYRGNVVNRGRSVADRGRSVANSTGPVSRVPVRRSTLSGDANSRSSYGRETGRVIDRSNIDSRTSRDYSGIQDRYRTRSMERNTSVDRSTINRTDRNAYPTRSMDRGRSNPFDSRSVSPTRSSTDRYAPNTRSNQGNYSPYNRTNQRTYSPDRSNNRNYTPSNRSNSRQNYSPNRSGNNRSYSPRGNNSGSNRSGYSAPSRSSSPSYNRSSGGSRGSSVSPSRSSSSPRSSGSSSRGSGSSSRRGGN